MNGTRLKALLESGNIIVAPGVYDHLSLLMADQLGFSALNASGYWSTAPAHDGKTPVFTPDEYVELGVGIVIYPAGAALSAAKAAASF